MNNMEVTILTDQKKAVDQHGNIYNIKGIEITRQNSGIKEQYSTDTNYYKVVAASGTKSKAYILSNGQIMLT